MDAAEVRVKVVEAELGERFDEGFDTDAARRAEHERRAAQRGHRTEQLETNRALTETIELYRQAGDVEGPAHDDEPHADHWFTEVHPSG